MRTKNIFHRIVKDENNFTELFVNLMVYDDFRNFIAKYINERIRCAENVFNFEFQDIDTQFRTSLSGQPDIKIENDKALVLCEVKIRINTEITPNQSVGYFAIFNQKPIKGLIFIIPKLYQHQNIIQSAFNNCQLKDEHIKTCILYWEDILNAMKKEKFSEEQIFTHFINHAKKWCTYSHAVFTQNHIKMIKDKEYAKALLNLYGIVNNVEKLLSAKISGINITFKKDISDSQYCLYFYDEHNREMLYFGIWYELWAQEGVPLCLGFRDDFPEEYKKSIIDFMNNDGIKPISEQIGDWDNWNTYNVSSMIIEGEDAGITLKDYIIGLLEKIRSNNFK